jgi:hypothetical protein
VWESNAHQPIHDILWLLLPVHHYRSLLDHQRLLHADRFDRLCHRLLLRGHFKRLHFGSLLRSSLLVDANHGARSIALTGHHRIL